LEKFYKKDTILSLSSRLVKVRARDVRARDGKTDNDIWLRQRATARHPCPTSARRVWASVMMIESSGVDKKY
jgi:hypothetical protein